MKDKLGGRVLRCWVGNMKYHNLFNTLSHTYFIHRDMNDSASLWRAKNGVQSLRCVGQ